MKNDFKNYLIKEGYKEYTPSGLPSTVFQYLKSIDFVCEEEGLWNLSQLANNIDHYVSIYDIGGRKEHLGELSHRTVINALKRFRDYLQEVDYEYEILISSEYSKPAQPKSILSQSNDSNDKCEENAKPEIKYAGVGSTVTYYILEDNEINQVTIVEPMRKKSVDEISKTSELGEALMFCKEGEERKVNSPEPYMIKIMHISNPINKNKPNDPQNKTLRNLLNNKITHEPLEDFIPAAADDYANVKFEVENGLKVGYIYGSAAKDIYMKGCKAFGWDYSNVHSFGSLQILFSKHCTAEGYSVWFLPYSNLNNRKNPRANWRDLIDIDFTTIKEYWNSIDERFYCDKDKRLTFASQKNGQYIYLGIFQAQEINELDKCKIFKRIDTNYFG